MHDSLVQHPWRQQFIHIRRPVWGKQWNLCTQFMDYIASLPLFSLLALLNIPHNTLQYTVPERGPIHVPRYISPTRSILDFICTKITNDWNIDYKDSESVSALTSTLLHWRYSVYCQGWNPNTTHLGRQVLENRSGISRKRCLCIIITPQNTNLLPLVFYQMPQAPANSHTANYYHDAINAGQLICTTDWWGTKKPM